MLGHMMLNNVFLTYYYLRLTGLSITTEVHTVRETLVVIQAVNWLSAGWQTANNNRRALAVRCDWLLVQEGDSQ